jgi:hypothetical protein
MQVGDQVVLTENVKVSEMYPWLEPGAAGVIEGVLMTEKPEYPYQVRFTGDFVIDPYGCPVIARNPAFLFSSDEIKQVEGG